MKHRRGTPPPGFISSNYLTAQEIAWGLALSETSELFLRIIRWVTGERVNKGTVSRLGSQKQSLNRLRDYFQG